MKTPVEPAEKTPPASDVEPVVSPFVVTEKAQRPANMNGKCFYCHQKIGDKHKVDCVLVKKKVKVKMKLEVEYEVEVPADWDKDQIEFHRNEGSWCANNALEELENLEGCLCDDAEFEYMEDTSTPFLGEG